MLKLSNFIGGQWQGSVSGRTLQAAASDDGSIFATFPASSFDEVNRAVSSSRGAQNQWVSLPLDERLAMLRKFADRIESRAEEIAREEQREMGKPIAVAHQFLQAGLSAFRAALEDGGNYPFHTSIKGANGTTEINRSALGVVAQIVPWNFTVAQILVNLGPLLASGNTVIIKPSEKATPSACILFEENLLPSGVLNLVLGDGQAGKALAAHTDIDLVVFTGSIATGRKIAQAAGSNLNRSILELGGKDAAIVDVGVDVESVAMDVAAGSFLNSGQICTSMERIYVHQDIAESFLPALVEASKIFAEGGRMAIGPMVDNDQARIVAEHVSDAVALGAEVIAGGIPTEVNGNYFPPTVLTGITGNMLIAQQETFGPVAPITVVDSFATALELARESEYGLAATVYSNNAENLAAARDIEAAVIWINGWQASDGIRQAEPARSSGMGAMGGTLSYDAATRPTTVFVPHEGGRP